MRDEQFETDNHLGLTKDFIELSQITSFIKYLILLKIFIFINATKDWSFLLQPKKPAFATIGKNKMLDFTYEKPRSNLKYISSSKSLFSYDSKRASH